MKRNAATRCLTLLLVLVCASGCDAYYDTIIDNHTDKAISVQIGGPFKNVVVEPCSTYYSCCQFAPANGKPDAFVYDPSGTVLFKGLITPIMFGKGENRLLFLRIMPVSGLPCGTEITTTLSVSVTSNVDEPILVMFGDTKLGTVEPRAHADYGPLQGSLLGVDAMDPYHEARKVTVVDPNGKSVWDRQGDRILCSRSVRDWSPDRPAVIDVDIHYYQDQAPSWSTPYSRR